MPGALGIMERIEFEGKVLHDKKGTIEHEISKLKFNMQENTMVHNSYMREKRQLEFIRQGDIEGVRKSTDEPMQGPVGILAKEPLQSRKYVAVCAMAVYARAAIDGGVLSDDAFAAGDSWAMKIDEATSEEEIDQYGAEMPVFFAQMVKDQKLRNKKEQGNRLVEQCKKYVFQHMHEKISVRGIAEALYVNPDYLSDLFSKKVGMTIKQYISQEKVNLSKNLLIYSPYDCKSIANYLGFSSQSHFGKVFREHTGMTPNEYRIRYAKDIF